MIFNKRKQVLIQTAFFFCALPVFLGIQLPVQMQQKLLDIQRNLFFPGIVVGMQVSGKYFMSIIYSFYIL